MKQLILFNLFLILILNAICVQCNTMMNHELEIQEITNEAQRCQLGEGPHWDAKSQSLYFVDILSSAILRYDSLTGDIYKAKIKDNDSKSIGFVIPVEDKDDEFVVGVEREIMIIRWDGKSREASVVQVLAEVDQGKPKNRINDGKCDLNGELFFGTMGDENSDLKTNPSAAFYQLKGNVAISLKEAIGISNGLTWDKSRGKFYYIDSVARDVKVFDYDWSKSNISNESVLIDFDKIFEADVFPDGMTIDENGNLYVATWGGSKVYVIDPSEKKIIREIDMPTSQVTSLAFGGSNFEVLYVTTAAKGNQNLSAGGLFKITGLNAKGRIMNNFKYY